jgi:hypothetical protein
LILTEAIMVAPQFRYALAVGMMLCVFASPRLVGDEPGSTGPVKAVRPLPADALKGRDASARVQQLLSTYRASVREWSGVLRGRIQPVRGKPGCAYYGDPGHEENDVRPIAYAALVNAFLAETEPPAGGAESSADERARLRSDAMAALRYLVQGHVTGGGACLNGKQWGNQWQSAMWARSLGLAGWILWAQLDDLLRARVARVVEFEADRFLNLKPKSNEFKDTGAEENAWNAQILSLACNMMPGHPRAQQWEQEAKRWMYNSLSAAVDTKDETPGDDGRAVRQWVTTVNVHPDFTVENHGIVHVGYLKASLAFLLENALPYLLTGRPVPKACSHHVRDCFAVALKCMGWDGAPVYFSGNDWKIYHSQNSDVMIFTLAALLAGDRNAAALEPVALDYLRRMQRVEGGYYSVRRDIEYGGLCASRLIACQLARGILGEGPLPASEAECERSICGVTCFEHGRVILHRTPTKFASFSWGEKRMALCLPRNGSWVVWPHFASFVGHVNGKDASPRNAKLKKLQHELGQDKFTVTSLVERLDGAVEQAVSFASLPGDVAVYVERLTARKGFQLQSREGGIVGLEYELGCNERTLFGRHGKTKAVGTGGERGVTEIVGDWLNIDGRIGYVVRRWPAQPNTMRYHGEIKGSGRVPVLQEWLSLIGESSAGELSGTARWACVVALPNAGAEQTVAQADRIRFEVEGNQAVCRIGPNIVRVDFDGLKTAIEEK